MLRVSSLALCVLLGCQAAGSPSLVEPKSNDVTVEAVPSKPDHAADCSRAQGALEIAPPSQPGVDAANIVPESQAERDGKLERIDGDLAAWKRVEALVTSSDVREATLRYVAALVKQRAVVASLKFDQPEPASGPAGSTPTATKPDGSATDPHLARQAALRDAAEFGVQGLLGQEVGPFLGEAERTRFNKARLEYLDAWEPLMRLCSR